MSDHERLRQLANEVRRKIFEKVSGIRRSLLERYADGHGLRVVVYKNSARADLDWQHALPYCDVEKLLKEVLQEINPEYVRDLDRGFGIGIELWRNRVPSVTKLPPVRHDILPQRQP